MQHRSAKDHRLVADTGEWGTYGWGEHVLGAPGYRIAGGSDEVQRNIIGERARPSAGTAGGQESVVAGHVAIAALRDQAAVGIGVAIVRRQRIVLSTCRSLVHIS